MFALLFLQASMASLLAGACAWLLLRTAARIWPALEARRAPWLLAAAAVAGTLALGLLPPATRPSIVPTLELPAAQPASASTAFADGDEAAFDDHHAMPIEPAPVLRWLGYAWLTLYGAGLAASAARWRVAKRPHRAACRLRPGRVEA